MRIIRTIIKLPALIALAAGRLVELIAQFAVTMAGMLLRIAAAVLFLIADMSASRTEFMTCSR